MPNKKFQILAEKLSDVQARLDFIGKKAVKYGFKKPVLTILGEFMHTQDGVCYKMVDVEVSGETPIINGWQLAAIIRPVNNELNLLSVFPDFQVEIPAHYHTVSAVCEHCGKTRNRNETFLIWSENEGFKQIGRNCLADYTGGLDPEAAVWWAQFLPTLQELTDDDDYRMGGTPHYSTLRYIASVIEVIESHGWASRATSDYPTAQRAINYMIEYSGKTSDEAFEKAHRILTWVTETVKTTKDTFEMNVFAAVIAEHVTRHTMGLAAYAVVMFDKANQVTSKGGEFVGIIGDKITLTATLKSYRKIEGYYGVKHMYQFEDIYGNTIVWWASGEQSLTVDSTVNMTATVKEHTVYNEVKQTVITRAKVK